MIKSMTGFGKALVNTDKNNYQIEIRSLNSKQVDLNLRIPFFLKEYELDLRNFISKSLIRGKIDVNINNEKITDDILPSINHIVAEHYHKELEMLSQKLELASSNEIMSIILKMPDVLTSPVESVDPKEYEQLKSGIELAIQNVEKFRSAEGATLADDLKERIITILDLLDQVDPYEPERAKKIKERIKTNLTNFSDDVQQDENRLEQEMIYYIEKLDITEEKVRLKKHCEYFLETMKNENSSGKKLGFITQEIGREINTMGAKANDADIQKIVVLMKDELEKIKEQLFNIL
jgi:uncharacterized protein (TIGR00255 family)